MSVELLYFLYKSEEIEKMIKRHKENLIFKHLIWLTVVYFAAHWFLLVATGRWWDDWVYANKNWDYLLEVFMQSSLPLHAFIDAGLWIFPDGFDRILTFVLFYVGGIFVYLILNKIDFLETEDCFWITLLYLVIPINDARITWICYGYSLGLFIFWLSFYFSTLWKEKADKKISILRIISLILLLISFDTESIMLMTLLILGYFYYKDLKEGWVWKEWKSNIKKFLKSVLMHIDYLIAPMAWYAMDKMLFPGYGKYGGHSYILWYAVPGIIAKSPFFALITLKGILINYVALIKDKGALLLLTVIVAFYIVVCMIVRKKKEISEENESFMHNIWMMLLGAGVFFVGFFPYAVKRNGAISVSTYIEGRDTILLGIGVAILLYFGIYCFFRDKICKLILVAIISLGIIHFNFIYMDWQECYYQQLQLQDEIAENKAILDGNTFLIMYRGDKISSCFYQTNGNSWAATGEETRYFMPGVERIGSLIEMDKDTWHLNAFGMKEYDYTDKIIDGVIFVDYENISRGILIRQKWNELFHKDIFRSWIHDIKNIKYVAISQEESDALLQMYSDGTITNDLIYDLYYEQ